MQGHFEDLGQLKAVSETGLLHLLTCPECRGWAIGGLLRESAAAEEEDETQDYGALFARLEEVDPVRLEEVQERRMEAERRFEELVGMPGEERLAALQAPRFRNSDVLDTLLEQCHALQLKDPRQAAQIGGLAIQLAADLIETKKEPVEHLHRALCLEINALRLAGEIEKTEALLGWVPVSQGLSENRAFYCRLLAIVRWEQGRADEATALLEYAEGLYRRGPPGEHGVCLALLGLLAAEEENVGDALPLLHQGWALMDRELRPLLALRVALSLSFCFAAAAQEEQARRFYEEGLRLVTDFLEREETVRARWLEARALGWLGRKKDARVLLHSVVRGLIAEGSLAEAVLAGLDLALLSEGAETGELSKLLGSLDFEPRHASTLELAVNAVEALGRGEGGRKASEAKVKLIRDFLRRTFRSCGLPMRPLPFV